MVTVPLDVLRCDEVADHLSELLDGELDASARARVVLHLGLCPACARLAAELAATVEALHRLAWQACGSSRSLR